MRPKKMKRLVTIKVLAALWLILCLPLLAWPAQRQREPRLPGYNPRPHSAGPSEYTFARLQYGSTNRRSSWAVDWPKADIQFIYGLRGWVNSLLDISDDPATVSLYDKELFNYPFIYAVEPGGMYLSTEEAANLREYLLRGGFLIMDDFWGEWEWENVQEQMRRVFPEYPIQELPLSHPFFHCYFDINQVVQVPNIGNAYRGITHEKGGIVPHYEGIVGPDGRIMVFIARNTDNGDAWEWIDDPGYPLKYGLAAYRLGMNAIIYSMTH
jgi:hypothetical protein